MKNSPTQRSLRRLRADGWLVELVEKWNGFARKRQDLFGFVDVLAIKGDTVLAVQVTTADHLSHRAAKIKATQAAAVWLESPNRKIIVHGWRRPSGKRRTWTLREVELSSGGLAAASGVHAGKPPAPSADGAGAGFSLSAVGSARCPENNPPAAESRSPAAGFPVAIAISKALEGPLPSERLAKQFAAPLPGGSRAALPGAAADAIFNGGAGFRI